MSGIAIAGVSALPLALLPLRGLSGQSIWAFSRFLWLALYSLSVAGFLIVLVPLPDSWQLVELDLVAWSIGYAVYLGVAIVAWLIAAQPWKREEVESASKIAGEGCYHVVVACDDDTTLETFTQSLLAFGRYKVASEMRRVKD